MISYGFTDEWLKESVKGQARVTISTVYLLAK
jgi:hypothetical protein